MEFLTSNMLSDKQFGVVPGRSCTLQLLVCVEQWSKQFDLGTGVDTIYTDFSKAFEFRIPSYCLKSLALVLKVTSPTG